MDNHAAEPHRWSYEEYSAWSRQLAANYTSLELLKRLAEIEKQLGRATSSHLNAVAASTSPTSCSQRRAHTRNVVAGLGQEKAAILDALDIYAMHPERAKARPGDA
jgi:hypothetical protein